MATKRQRNGVWHYTVKRKGLLEKPIYMSFDNETEGDEYVANLEKLLDQGIVPDAFKKTKRAISSIGQAIDVYTETDDVEVLVEGKKAHRHIPESDKKLLAVIKGRRGSVELAKVDYIWAEEWIAGMKGDNLSPSTIRHHVGALARCFDWLVNRGDTPLQVNPLRMLPKKYASGHKDEVERDRRLATEEQEEVLRILNGGKPKDRERAFELRYRESLLLLFWLALETGMRLREMFTLDITQVDLKRRTIFLEKTKNGDKRQVPLTSVIMKKLEAYMADPEHNYNGRLFPWWDGRKETLAEVTSQLSKQFARIFDAAGCGEMTFHGLRHEATCRLYELTDMSDVQIAKMLGWKSMKMALRYANLRGSDLAELLW